MRLNLKFLGFIFLGLIILLIGGFGFSSCGGGEKASLRIMHASPDAPPVDVFIDGRLALSDVPYKGASGFLEIDAGTRNIKVSASGTSESIIDEDIDFAEDSLTTIVAVDYVSQIDASVLSDTDLPPGEGNLKIRVVHESPSAPAVDIYVTAPDEDLSMIDPVIENLAFMGYSDFLEIPEGSYQIRVTTTGSKTPVYDSGTITLEAGSILTSVAVNSTEETSMISLVVLTNDVGNPSFEIPDSQESQGGQAMLRIVHASPDAPNVDVLVDDAVVLSDVAFKGFNQDYLAVEAGNRNLKVNAAGTENSVIDTSIEVEEETDYTILAVNFLAQIEPLILIDDNTQPPSGKAKVRVIHASPDAPNVDVLVDDMVALTDVAFKGFSDYLEVEAGPHNFKVNATGTADSVIDEMPTLEDGGVYLVIAVNNLDNIELLLIKTN